MNLEKCEIDVLLKVINERLDKSIYDYDFEETLTPEELFTLTSLKIMLNILIK